MKVDFVTRIHWPFLFSILDWWGFNKKWCEWIKLCMCHAKVTILVNGEVTNWFKTRRGGVLQGDPPSPFLFLLVAKCLSRMTNVAISNNFIKRIGPSDESRTTFIQFAHDTLFFCEARKCYMRNLKFLWHLFKWASRMKARRKKTELYYTGQIEEKRQDSRSYWGAELVASLPNT